MLYISNPFENCLNENNFQYSQENINLQQIYKISKKTHIFQDKAVLKVELKFWQEHM